MFLQTVRDMQREHIETLADGDPWKVRWVLLRGYWSVGAAVIAQAPVSFIRLIVTLWKAAN